MGPLGGKWWKGGQGGSAKSEHMAVRPEWGEDSERHGGGRNGITLPGSTME